MQASLNLIQDLTTLLNFTKTLSKRERKRLLRVGDERKAFTARAIFYAETHKDVLTPLIKPEELSAVFNLANNTEAVLRHLEPLVDGLKDLNRYALSGLFRESY